MPHFTQKLSLQKIDALYQFPLVPTTEWHAPRCWALDFQASRFFLKGILRLNNPMWCIPIFRSRDAVFDPELNRLAVLLGLDEYAAPPKQLCSFLRYTRVFVYLNLKLFFTLGGVEFGVLEGLQALSRKPLMA